MQICFDVFSNALLNTSTPLVALSEALLFFCNDKANRSIQDKVSGGVELTIPDTTGHSAQPEQGTRFLQKAAERPCSLATKKAHFGNTRAEERWCHYRETLWTLTLLPGISRGPGNKHTALSH